MRKLLLLTTAIILSINVWGQNADKIIVKDTRDVDDQPIDYDKEVVYEFKRRSTIGVPGSGSYSGMMTFAPWIDNSGDASHQLNFNEGGIFYRTGQPSNTTWDSWRQLLISDENGNVGIGTTNPDNKFHILKGSAGNITSNGNAVATIENSGNAGLQFLSPNTSNQYVFFGDVDDTYAGYIAYTHSDNKMLFRTNAKQRMTIDGRGNVGIGTTSPTEKLEVKDGNFRLSNLTGVAYGSLGKIDFYNYASAASVVSARIEGKRDSYSHKDGRLSFYTSDNDGNLNEQLTIDRNGKIGIGTTSPSAGFDVFMSTNDYWTAKIKNNGGSSKGLLLEVGYGGGPVATIMQLNDGSGNVRAVFKSNGNVGIGTTNPTYKLAVTGTIGCGELIVEDVTGWADFVFEDDYNLMSLKDLDKYIQANKRLPEIPTTAEVEKNGISIGEMNAKLLQKIEELTLYTIEQQKIIEKQEQDYNELKKEIEQIKQLIK